MARLIQNVRRLADKQDVFRLLEVTFRSGATHKMFCRDKK